MVLNVLLPLIVGYSVRIWFAVLVLSTQDTFAPKRCIVVHTVVLIGGNKVPLPSPVKVVAQRLSKGG